MANELRPEALIDRDSLKVSKSPWAATTRSAG